jgi:folate-dependent phosphoribosylglycinamide formyltransferase PurN
LYGCQDRTMRVAVFSSRGPGNFLAAINAARASDGQFSVCLLVTDRPGIPAIAAADNERVPVIVGDFATALRGLDSDRRGTVANQLHDAILYRIRDYEASSGPIDLCVLAYRRIIRGSLFQYFRDRMINQHPADLTIREWPTGRRAYVGMQGLGLSIAAGAASTRTSTILVSSVVDGGEILVQGPQVPVESTDVATHEQRQKESSDWPALKRCLIEIASGHLRISSTRWPDGCRQVFLGDSPLPYGGLQLS